MNCQGIGRTLLLLGIVQNTFSGFPYMSSSIRSQNRRPMRVCTTLPGVYLVIEETLKDTSLDSMMYVRGVPTT